MEKQAIRQKNKDILSIEIRKLCSEIIKLEEQFKNQSSVPTTPLNNTPLNPTSKRYEVKLTNYGKSYPVCCNNSSLIFYIILAWDQTNKFVKFYVTLKNVHNIPAENVRCDFTHKNLELKVSNLENKDYIFKLNSLLKSIEPEQSNWKIKTGKINITVPS